jgi:hypothetical protein
MSNGLLAELIYCRFQVLVSVLKALKRAIKRGLIVL